MNHKLELVPMRFVEAIAFVDRNHRHAKPPRGHKFSVGAARNGALIGVVMVGRPVARGHDDGWTLEINRLCCLEGERNAASFLLGAAARAAFALGYRRLCSYTLQTESGASMRAAGWRCVAEIKGRQWDCASRPREKREVADRLLWELAA